MEDVSVVVRVRDRYLVRVAVSQAYTGHKTGSWAPPREVISTIIEHAWESRLASTDREAFGGISRAVTRLLSLFKKAPQAWRRLQEGLGINPDLPLPEKIRLLGVTLKDYLAEGKKVLGKAFHHMATSFPLSLFFVERGKMPGLTSLIHRIIENNPRLKKALNSIGAGTVKVEDWLKKYVPVLRRPLYAAIFIWVWLNVAELSWDVQGILSGFSGNISFSELLASLPESGLGLIAASFGLGYGALPYVLIARIAWLVAHKYVSWVPGKGLRVHWSAMGIQQPDEMVAA